MKNECGVVWQKPQVGDRITIAGVVTSRPNNDVWVTCKPDDQWGNPAYVSVRTASILTVTPREIRVGDKVARCPPWYGSGEAVVPWKLDRLQELEDLLRRVKDLEDRLGCPCEPNKADYLGLLRERIEKLEAAAASQAGK